MSRQNEIEARVQKLESEVTRLQSQVTDLSELQNKVSTLSETVQEEMKVLSVNLQQELKEVKESAPSASVAGFLAKAAAGAVFPTSPVLNLASEANPSGIKRTWILSEVLRDLRTVFQMYFDPRYRLRRATQLLVPSIVITLIVTYLFFNYAFSILFISPILERLIEMILAVFLYKVLSQEISRYREAVRAYEAMTSGVRPPVPVQMLTNTPDNAPHTPHEGDL